MAITIEQYPSSQIMPVYNTIAFTVDSTNKAQCAFRYICDVYVNGTFVKRLKRFPIGSSGFATFKINRILEDYLSFDLKNNLYGTYLFSKNSNSLLDYELKFGEEYDSSAQCDAGTTIYANLKSSNNIFSPVQKFSAFNGALQKKEWLQWDDINYTAYDVNGKFLTRMPERALITIGSQLTFNIFNYDIEKLQVKTYSEAGTLLGTYTYTNPYGSVNNQTDRLLIVGVGTENLNNSTLLSGSQPVINDSVAYYTVQLLKTADAVCSELKRIDIDRRCTVFEPHRVWFLGRLGGFDSYTYTLRSTRKLDINRSEFKHIYGANEYVSPGYEWSYEMKDRGRTTLSVNAQSSEIWNSNWLTEAEALWMEELFTSIEVYEQVLNLPICFSAVTVVITAGVGPGDPDVYTITIPIETTQEVGEYIFLSNNSYTELNGSFQIISKTDTTATIAWVFGGTYPAGVLANSGGTYTYLLFDADMLPLIFATNSYDEKIKRNTKNINYFIEVQDSDAVNVQRN